MALTRELPNIPEVGKMGMQVRSQVARAAIPLAASHRPSAGHVLVEINSFSGSNKSRNHRLSRVLARSPIVSFARHRLAKLMSASWGVQQALRQTFW